MTKIRLDAYLRLKFGPDEHKRVKRWLLTREKMSLMITYELKTVLDHHFMSDKLDKMSTYEWKIGLDDYLRVKNRTRWESTSRAERPKMVSMTT